MAFQLDFWASKKWLIGPLLAALTVGLGFFAALLGSDHWLWIVGATLCGLALLGCFCLALDFRFMTGPRRLAVGYVTLTSAVWFISGLSYTRSMVYVENGTAKTLVVELNGRPWLSVPGSESIKMRLARKPYQMVVRSEDGTQLDTRSLVVGPKKAYVLNLLGARTYHRGLAGYGVVSAHRTSNIQDVWIEADVDDLFEDPPSSVSAPKGVSGTLRSYLQRGSSPKDTERQ
jgi:hypothetical protein